MPSFDLTYFNARFVSEIDDPRFLVAIDPATGARPLPPGIERRNADFVMAPKARIVVDVATRFSSR